MSAGMIVSVAHFSGFTKILAQPLGLFEANSCKMVFRGVLKTQPNIYDRAF